MTTADREHAAQQLLTFLGQVGPLEAIWAMTTALEELQEQPAGRDHVAATRRALFEAIDEASEMTASQAPTNAASGVKSRAKKAPAVEGEQS